MPAENILFAEDPLKEALLVGWTNENEFKAGDRVRLRELSVLGGRRRDKAHRYGINPGRVYQVRDTAEIPIGYEGKEYPRFYLRLSIRKVSELKTEFYPSYWFRRADDAQSS